VLDRTPAYYERLETSYDPRFYKQEVLGEYLNSKADRVYHCFNAAVHLVRQAYDSRKTLFWALDFNVAPMSSVLVQEHKGRLVAIDEIVLERATTEEAGQEFENRYKGHGAGLEIFGDASGRNMHTTGTTDYSMLQAFLYRAGFRHVKVNVPPKNPPVLSRVQIVIALLTRALGEVSREVDPRWKTVEGVADWKRWKNTRMFGASDASARWRTRATEKLDTGVEPSAHAMATAEVSSAGNTLSMRSSANRTSPRPRSYQAAIACFCTSR